LEENHGQGLIEMILDLRLLIKSDIISLAEYLAKIISIPFCRVENEFFKFSANWWKIFHYETFIQVYGEQPCEYFDEAQRHVFA